MHLVLDIIFIVIFSVYLWWFWGLVRALTLDAPFVPMRRKVVRDLVDAVHPKPGSVWIDLGSGDGRLLIEAVKRHNITGIGIEKVQSLRVLSRINIFRSGFTKQIRIQNGNFFKADLSQADIVSGYLLPDTNKRLVPKLKKELRPGSLVVTHRFKIYELKEVSSNPKTKIYVYTI